MTGTAARKGSHTRVCLEEQVAYRTRTTGLERWDLPYHALPGIDLDDVDLSVELFGRRLSAPVLIGAMTGGTELAARINRNLALAAERLGVGMMLGSQRVMLESPGALAGFQVREYAPTTLLIGNLGAVQLTLGYTEEHMDRAVGLVGADAMALHINPLQEAMQENGDTGFRNVLDRIAEVVPRVRYPVVLKEVGHGVSGAVAARLHGLGLAAIDVAGAGGTSWARVEQLVRHGRVTSPDLAEWGTPTATALSEVRKCGPPVPLIASGGIRSGADAAKCLALGASAVAVAHPLLAPATESAEAVTDRLGRLLAELRISAFCAGARNAAALSRLTPVPRPPHPREG